MRKILGLMVMTLAVSVWAEPLKVQYKSSEGVTCDGKTLVFNCGSGKPRSLSSHGSMRLDDKYLGKTFRIRAKVTGENFSNPAGFHIQLVLGSKIVCEAVGERERIRETGSITNGTGQIEIVYAGYGSTPWGTLSFGTGNSTGKISVDLTSLEIDIMPDMYPQVNQDWVCEYSDRVAKDVRRRGAMLGIVPAMTEKDIEDLAAYGANLARYQMWHGDVKMREGEETVLEFFNRWLDKRLDHLEKVVLPTAKRVGMKICIDLHDTPGYRNGTHQKMFHDVVLRDQLVDAWRKIATRLKGHDEIYGYDLYNEPEQHGMADPECDYWTCQLKCIEAIRKIDPDTPIVVEGNFSSGARSYAFMSPFPYKDIIYQLHFYDPHPYTHQGVGKKWDKLMYSYRPNGKPFISREKMRKWMNPVIEFSKKHKAKVYVGEFSSICWAPENARWLADAIACFEEQGWDWTMHAYREWTGWSFEHETTRYNGMKRVPTGPRKVVVTDGFKGKTHDLSVNWKLPEGTVITNGQLTLKGGQVATAEVDISPYVDTTVEVSVKTTGKNLKPYQLLLALGAYNEWMQEEESVDGWNRDDSTMQNGTDILRTWVPMYKMRPGKGTVRLGLRASEGTATFDLTTFQIRWVPDLTPQVNQDWKCKYTDRVTKDVRRLGCMLGIEPVLQDKDYRDLAAYGANLARYQMFHAGTGLKMKEDETRGEYWERWLAAHLDNLETNVLVAAKKYGLKIVVDLHDAPGCRWRSMQRMFFDEDPETGEKRDYLRQFTNGWAQIARRFKGNEQIYGFDLYNEPTQDIPALPGHDLWSCNYWATKAIREVDPEVPVIVECGDWDHAKGYRYFSPIPFDNVIYSLHFYSPHHYTHQGVGPNAMTGPYQVAAKSGTSPTEGEAYLKRCMACARAFQLKHGARMFVGEFSVVAWAPEADKWLKPVVDLFEEYGWDWTWHAYREYIGWSFEYEGDPKTRKLWRSKDNPRKRIILDCFKRNPKK